MGGLAPKSEGGGLDLDELEEAVKDAVSGGHCKDAHLSKWIEITLISVIGNRPLFQNPLEEPVFYRKYLRRWVVEALKENDKMEAASNAILRALGEIGAKPPVPSP